LCKQKANGSFVERYCGKALAAGGNMSGKALAAGENLKHACHCSAKREPLPANISQRENLLVLQSQ